MARMVSMVAVEFALRARADSILAMRDPARLQLHSRALPSEAELAEARFAARQFEAAADDLAAGLLLEHGQ